MAKIKEQLLESLPILAECPPGRLITRAYLQGIRNVNAFGTPVAGGTTIIVEFVADVVTTLKDMSLRKEIESIVEDIYLLFS